MHIIDINTEKYFKVKFFNYGMFLRSSGSSANNMSQLTNVEKRQLKEGYLFKILEESKSPVIWCIVIDLAGLCYVITTEMIQFVSLEPESINNRFEIINFEDQKNEK
jgi:hypothetical protein